MHDRLSGLAMVVVCALACADEPSTLEIRPIGSLTDSTNLAGIELIVADRTLRAGDFAPNEDGFYVVTLDVPDSGPLVALARLSEAGEQIAEGTSGWPLANGFEWWMLVYRQRGDPSEVCFGCLGSAGFPIAQEAAREPGEALWIVWGGKPRGSDIVY